MAQDIKSWANKFKSLSNSDPFSSERFKLITDDVLYGNDNSSEDGEFDEY
jgi:hypothetical protein